ncbi:hypothetical protein SCHPADRAFT_438079 [Schizopora paradoxa]|uniref:Uncharacterized protein n=1 Tax=Schizopora paradoxa TaxID=27342 RepID=A0A0H2RRJ4_9AGAM|nr:hypothetical protein SCHPADRAFT_438079 [Schizopora paradoxa]
MLASERRHCLELLLFIVRRIELIVNVDVERKPSPSENFCIVILGGWCQTRLPRLVSLRTASLLFFSVTYASFCQLERLLVHIPTFSVISLTSQQDSSPQRTSFSVEWIPVRRKSLCNNSFGRPTFRPVPESCALDAEHCFSTCSSPFRRGLPALV